MVTPFWELVLVRDALRRKMTQDILFLTRLIEITEIIIQATTRKSQ